MNNLKLTRGVSAVFVLFALIILAGLLTGPIYSNQTYASPWLMQFENGPVTVTFITAPPAKQKIIEARLIAVETSGLVLRFPQDRDKFYPYAGILSVDPK